MNRQNISRAQNGFWKLFLCLLPLVILSNCRYIDNTEFASGFTKEAFERLRVNVDSVNSTTAALGQPLEVYYNVEDYPNGSSNAIGKLDPAAKLRETVYCYSRPSNTKRDFLVYRAVFDQGGVLIRKTVYKTD